MPGTLVRAKAIMPPGIFLSQPPITTTPSCQSPLTQTSILSAITSRDTREYFIPSVPIPMPSETVGVPNICAFAPASSKALTAASANFCKPLLHGVIVE